MEMPLTVSNGCQGRFFFYGEFLGRLINGNGEPGKVLRVPCDDQIHTGSFCACNHDGVFVVMILENECILTIFAKRIDNFEQGQESGNKRLIFFHMKNAIIFQKFI